MKLYFHIKEFVIAPEFGVSIDIADKILHNFIYPLQFIRHNLGVPLIISKRSGYRHLQYELQRGRNGRSPHSFTGKGAADLTCSKMDELGEELRCNSPFTRITYYSKHNFYHVDFEFPERGRRYFICENKEWELIENLK